MNKIIERLMRFKSKNEYLFVPNIDTKRGRFFENPTTTGSHKNLTQYHLDHGYLSNYISLNVFKTDRRLRSEVAFSNGILFDFDAGDIESLVERVESLLGKATWKILTTPSKGKTQLIYLFAEREERLELVEKVSYTLTQWAESDHTWDLPRIFRNPYGINGKNQERSELIDETDTELTLDEVIKRLTEMDIPLIDPPKAAKKPSKRLKTEKPTPTVELNQKAPEYRKYEQFLDKYHGDKSRARYSLVKSLLARKFSNPRIIQISQEIGLDITDIERILGKERS